MSQNVLDTLPAAFLSDTGRTITEFLIRSGYLADGTDFAGFAKIGVPTALPPVATDLASVLTLANALRAVLIASGQGV